MGSKSLCVTVQSTTVYFLLMCFGEKVKHIQIADDSVPSWTIPFSLPLGSITWNVSSTREHSFTSIPPNFQVKEPPICGGKATNMGSA